MDRAQLRQLQAPLKRQYREDPASALVTFHAEATLSEGITCSIARGSATVAGLHPAAGGDGTELCSADMLLESLASCVGVTLKSVATSMGADVRGGHIAVDGDLDFRGTLAVERDVAVGFTSIRVAVTLDCDLAPELLETLLRLTERYCVVYQTLRSSPQVQTSWVTTAQPDRSRDVRT